MGPLSPWHLHHPRCLAVRREVHVLIPFRFTARCEVRGLCLPPRRHRRRIYSAFRERESIRYGSMQRESNRIIQLSSSTYFLPAYCLPTLAILRRCMYRYQLGVFGCELPKVHVPQASSLLCMLSFITSRAIEVNSAIRIRGKRAFCGGLDTHGYGTPFSVRVSDTYP